MNETKNEPKNEPKNLIEQNFDWENATWDVVDTFFKQDNILIKHHIDSFDHFLSYQLENIIHEKEFQLRIHDKSSYNAEKDMYGKSYVVEFGRVSIAKPVLQDAPHKPMYPSEARIRKLTYSSSLYVDIHHKTLITNMESGEVQEIRHPDILKFSLGKMPIMVGSKFCILSEQSNMTKVELGEGEYDLGGYFIVKGSEKVIVNHERKCENRAYCFKKKAGSKEIEEVSMKSIHPDMPKSISSIHIKMKAKEEVLGGHVLRFRVKKLKNDLPVVIIFRALGYESDRAITELIAYDIENEANRPIIDLFKASIEESKPIQTQEEALEYISKGMMGIPSTKSGKSKLRYTFEVLCNELFPHVGMNPIKKAYYLGYMINKMFKCHLGILPYDDRDSYMNKRIDTSGELMAQLFRDYFGRFFKELKGSCDKEMLQGPAHMMELPQNLQNKLKPNDIESGIKFALSTGNWGLKSSAQMKKGVAQVLQRVSFLGTMSNLRRIVSDLDKNVKQTEPRQLHNTQYGLICPFETPEGANIGIIKNMSLTAYITIPSDPTVIMNCLDELGVKAIDSLRPYDIAYSVKVFVNGDWYGQSLDPHFLTSRLRAMRRNGAINIYTSISWHIYKNEIHIWTDSGRLCRPLYVVKDNKIAITDDIVREMKTKNLTWKDLLSRPIQNRGNKVPQGCADYDDSDTIIEYLDVEEIDTCMVAMTIHNLEINSPKNDSFYRYTHCEIHPSMMLGVLTANIPYAEHNPAPRNMFQAAQCKQAMGIYTTAFKKRMDTLAYILHYPQKSLVNTMNSKYLHSEDIPAGQTAIVAIACYMGYNQEDSLIFNQSSVERGLYNSSLYKTYIDEEKKNLTTLEEEKFCKPEKFYANGKLKTEKMSFGSYEKLDADGFVKVGSRVDGNDIIIGKVVPIKNALEGEPKYRDASTALAETESGIIDMVYKNRNGDGYMFAKVRVKSDRDPELGDKFSSRHGQKGTIGMTLRQEDMPYTKDGVVPDIIMTPHALPKRMTIGQFIECIFGKAGIIAGSEFDSTPFRKVEIEKIGSIMESLGFSGAGTEVMYNGKTGKQLDTKIFIGPVFYHRLKHLSREKIHGRATGPYQLLVRQPAEGRSRGGGLRFGEMERDCLISHGSLQLLKERMFNCSDKFYVWIDKKTGTIGATNPEKGIYRSLYSDNTTDFCKVQIPYSTHLLIQELKSCCICLRIEV